MAATHELEAAESALIEAVTRDDLFRLGLMNSTETEAGGPDFVAAHKWFNLAANLGSAPAKAYRDELAREMSPTDVTQAQKDARQWMVGNRARLAQAA